MHFHLKIDTYGAVNANDLVGADACIGWNVTAAGWDCYISGIVSDGMVRTLYGRSYELPQKCLTRVGNRGVILRQHRKCPENQHCD